MADKVKIQEIQLGVVYSEEVLQVELQQEEVYLAVVVPEHQRKAVFSEMHSLNQQEQHPLEEVEQAYLVSLVAMVMVTLQLRHLLHLIY